LKFTDSNLDLIEIENIIIEPTNTGTNFVIYGNRKGETKKSKGYLVGIDFSSLHMRECMGFENPGEDEDSDYELWKPHGLVTPNCLLGREFSVVRRKRDAKCFNPN